MKKNIMFMVGITATLFVMSGCSYFSSFTQSKPSFVLANVLEQAFWQDCHIEGDINVPFMKVNEYADAHWDKEGTEIVLYCGNYKCTASGSAAKKLREKGFKKAYAYEGGTAEWRHYGYPTSGPATAAYLNDYKVPAGYDHTDSEGIVIDIQTLKKKVDQNSAKK